MTGPGLDPYYESETTPGTSWSGQDPEAGWYKDLR